jgi:large subunit ribosomal protein L24
MQRKFKIRKGDHVLVISGDEKNKTGAVVKVFPKSNTLLVEGVNLVKKHKKKSGGEKSEIVLKEAPIQISNVAFYDEELGVRTKVGFTLSEDNIKVRIGKRTKKILQDKIL